MAQRKPAEHTRTQQKFIEAAREHGASEGANVFRKAVRGVATAPGDKA